jgi:hypothetical protein
MVLVILTTDKNRRKTESQGEEKLEVGTLYASEKYSNISSIYHIFKENLIPIVFQSMPIRFYFVYTSVYHVTYRMFLRCDCRIVFGTLVVRVLRRMIIQ